VGSSRKENTAMMLATAVLVAAQAVAPAPGASY
jgi:hypothetical protein